MVVRGGRGGNRYVSGMTHQACVLIATKGGEGGREGSSTASLHRRRRGVSKEASAEMKQSWKSRKQWRKGWVRWER